MGEQEHEHTALLQAQGWKARALAGFIDTAGPLWTRREEDGWAYAVLCGARHLNPAGVVHGGLLMTLLDHAMSTVAWEAAARAPCVTVQMDTHFAGAVRAGQLAQARATVTRRTGGLMFMRGTVAVDGSLALSAQAVLKVLGSS